jgi:pyruvate/2-oxoglutarate dehydrogenase complex dihydrolipoamide dehydrogenase (E3) component
MLNAWSGYVLWSVTRGRAVIVGGGYIGLELTEAFRGRGLQTTVVKRTERLMPWLDPEMIRILDYHVRTQRLHLLSAAAIIRGPDHPLRGDPPVPGGAILEVEAS